MRINEFDDINLAVNFHDELNPELWAGDRLQNEVRVALMKIADHFKNFLGIDTYDLVDVTISGSNAAYTYTPHSDIDLHLVVMIPNAHEQELRELFDAKKYQYNDQHDITIRGYDVELYVQDAEQPHHSMGIYSVMKNKWLSKPKRQRADINDIDVQEKYESMQHRINQAIITSNYDRALKVWTDVKDMRQTGLDRGGEFSPENLAFKILRAQGYLDKLRTHVGALVDQGLSLDEDDEDGVKSPPMASPEIYLDMDGVLADFMSEYAQVAGLDHIPTQIPHPKDDPVLQKIVGSDFFARLNAYPTADQLVDMAVQVFGHYNICTSPLRGDHENAEAHKKMWIRNNLSVPPKQIIVTGVKSKYAVQPNGTPNILVDDKPKNITEWNAAGGFGIHYCADTDDLSLVKAGISQALKAIKRPQ